MSRYILDTDHVTLFQYENLQIAQRARTIGNANLFITTVTLEEQLRGRLAAISRAGTKPERLAIAHENLRNTVLYFCRVNLLSFDDAAFDRYTRLQTQKIRIGTQDLRIASLAKLSEGFALANEAILVTRNIHE